MPKSPSSRARQLQRQARRAASADPLPSLAATTLVREDAEKNEKESSVPLSRGQRKRLSKREQYYKKETMILSSLNLARLEEQKRRIDGLDSLKQALMETSAQEPPKESARTSSKASTGAATAVSSNKAKRRLVSDEVQHLGLILQHPKFKEDPFATMQEHLKNSLAEDRTEQEALSEERSKAENLKTEEKNRRKKERLEGVQRKGGRKKYKPRRTK